MPLEAIEHELLPFLITADIHRCRSWADKASRSRNVPIFWMRPCSATTRSRPMVNTRRTTCRSDAFRRLYVIIGDSNRSQWATMMKLATTHLVLCVIEQAGREGVNPIRTVRLRHPGAANHAVSRDASGVSAVLTWPMAM